MYSNLLRLISMALENNSEFENLSSEHAQIF